VHAVSDIAPSMVGRQTMWSGRRYLDYSAFMPQLFIKAGATEAYFRKGEVS